MNPTTAFIIAAALALVALVLVVWSAVELVNWLDDHTKRIMALEDILEDQILERALEDTIEENRLEDGVPNFLTLEHELEAVRRRSLAGRLEDSLDRLAALEDRLEQSATITRHYHSQWSRLIDETCDTCGGTGQWESTLEDEPTVLVDLGPCPDCVLVNLSTIEEEA